ncbi:hypothetical protein CN645_31535 [Burkholderia sp. IDO3]|nr:hypothetical protein DCN14_10785 [Burkholderia sp. IDO3]PCD57914.1 hypothetical protein CN645_31535 [Burkholderia sp. IDO3]
MCVSAATGGVAVGGNRIEGGAARGSVAASAARAVRRDALRHAFAHAGGPHGVRIERVPVRGEEFKHRVHDCPCGLRVRVTGCIVDAYPATQMLND